MKIKHLALVAAVTLITACGENDTKTTIQKVPQPKAPVANLALPDFDADSAYQYVADQVAFGPRVPNTEAHRNTAEYLKNQLTKFGAKITVQSGIVEAFDGTKLNFQNIIGSYHPDKANRVLLMAHWDTRPFADQDKKDRNKAIDGANDGGSGVGVLLEVARQFQIKNPTVGVDIVFFDAEDYGQPSGTINPKQATWCLGSQYWARNPHVKGYTAKYGILLDMVGAANAVFTQESISMYYAPQIVDKVWNVAARLGYSNYFPFMQTAHVGEDDHLYVNRIAKIPSIDIIQYDANTRAFAPHWHTHDDNMDIIDKNTLKAVGQVVLATVYGEK
jgi:Zn-dependent M28 family amino/carboxypeptidase